MHFPFVDLDLLQKDKMNQSLKNSAKHLGDLSLVEKEAVALALVYYWVRDCHALCFLFQASDCICHTLLLNFDDSSSYFSAWEHTL